MELVIKRFDELTRGELYEILRIRVDVFVVEQNCPYPEIDGKDEFAHHLYYRDADGIQALSLIHISFPFYASLAKRRHILRCCKK